MCLLEECPTDGSKSDVEGEMPYDIPYMWNLKMIQMNLLNRNRLTELDHELMVAREKEWGKGQLGSLGWTWTLCCV